MCSGETTIIELVNLKSIRFSVNDLCFFNRSVAALQKILLTSISSIKSQQKIGKSNTPFMKIRGDSFMRSVILDSLGTASV